MTLAAALRRTSQPLLFTLALAGFGLSLSACESPTKKSVAEANVHARYLADAADQDVGDVRHGLPEGAKKLVPPGGRDLGHVGEITQVNAAFLEMLLKQNYVPVISPISIGEDGQSFNVNADSAAAAIAAALKVDKLIFLSDAPGILDGDELITEVTASALRERIERGVISGGMVNKVRSLLKVVEAGVQQVHVIDGRTPHSIIGELFTDRGVGTLVTGG